MATYNLAAGAVAVSQALNTGISSVKVYNSGPCFVAVAFGEAGVVAIDTDRRVAPGESATLPVPLSTSTMSIVALERGQNCAVTVTEGTVDPRVPVDGYNPAAIAIAGSLRGVIPNNKDVANRNCTVLGDSISQGAFALNTFMHGWVRILQRCFNAEVGSSSYGFTNFLTLGSGGTTTTDVHQVQFFGTAWTGVDSSTDALAANYPPGIAMRAGDATSRITATVPMFQNRVRVYYGVQPNGGQFTVYINAANPVVINTAGAAGYAYQDFNLVDNGYGDCAVNLNCNSAATNPVDIIGLGYLSTSDEPVFNNFSNSGRRLAWLGQNVISQLMQESAILICALGINDQVQADADNAYYAQFMQRISWLTTYANQYGTKIVVPDFCWVAPSTSRTRLALKQLAIDTGGLYIDLPSAIFKAGTAPTTDYLINTIKMWTDGSHPNKNGHKWIAEAVAKQMGFSCSSKYDAIRYHDYWMPLALKSATGVYNYFPNDSALISSYRRNGAEILVKVFVRKAATGAFPIASYSLQDTWRTKSELTGVQEVVKAGLIRPDTGALVSTIDTTGAGAMTLNVISAFINDQDFTFSMPLTDGAL